MMTLLATSGVNDLLNKILLPIYHLPAKITFNAAQRTTAKQAYEELIKEIK
ncbi:hypothetical protein GL982_10870 (plasmid) [Spiroplasma citri]|uniref:Uncharacterized protein n=1 Tax=Spiroplasma citri TaxID=2133 RepID=A0AAJ4ELB6_SPICI|nr:hypothetical protein [Spiroplasma citri]QIA69919.1 hypothetical protein GL298_10845 [Spiroplasma citri]QIA71942.1 hypothetical protein GL981_11640 [Spiroplasma citri]QIA74046.1 hypothetical protein GL982_10870 [Spiroplasma citri]